MLSGIYKISNESNGKVYIGSSIDIDKRLRTHFNNLSRGKHHNLSLLSDFKEDSSVFKFEEIEKCSINDMITREDYWIDYFNSVDDGYNILRKSANTGKRKSSKGKRSKASIQRQEMEDRQFFCDTMREFVKFKDWDNPEGVHIALKTFHLQGRKGFNTKRVRKFSEIILDVMETCFTLEEGIYHIDHFNYLNGQCNYMISPVEETKYEITDNIYEHIANIIIDELSFPLGRKFLKDLYIRDIILLDE